MKILLAPRPRRMRRTVSRLGVSYISLDSAQVSAFDKRGLGKLDLGLALT